MEHPLISDISHLNVDELQTRITELSKKMSWAQRNNAYLASQIAMALETYRNQYQAKQQVIYDAATAKGSNNNYLDRIDIS